MRTVNTPRDAHVSPNLVRWGAVFAGTLISLGFFALVSTLWLALSYNDSEGSGWVSGNLPWFLGATAVSALFLAGLLSGFLSGVRGAGAGLLNGLTAWGLLFITSVMTVVPGLTAITMNLGAGLGSGSNTVGGSIGTVGGGVTAESAVWTTFWSLLAGAVVAAVGGIVGGAAKRQPKIADAQVRGGYESTRDADRQVYPVDPVTSVDVKRPAEDRVSTGIGAEETRRH